MKKLHSKYSNNTLAHDIMATNKVIAKYIKNGCEGTLELFEIDVAPDTLTHVGGSLHMHETLVRKLPDNLTVEWDLNLYGCNKLKVLPKGLKVGATLMLESSGITSLSQLPDDLEVGGEIFADSFGNKEAKEYLKRKRIKQLEDKLPEIRGLF